ncbi:uncharacterized protein BT62DRAFT_951489 [Guyanagaster necrorhizus]|uniref:RanBD1 domain-containing protein n=1 Tax=Guyanagaster necrorhizus TaxID=856835 RepID=A0A9P7VRG9_9AGAR|nr:uncharacterized protein BT62DRAFT_951489 [Guyanagaster necrorhizus MCA 3950]KAG7445125.1 hypothetical protein BT62DRAFT_951489 [Guyanagaster necrorhizus MCA 3950]
MLNSTTPAIVMSEVPPTEGSSSKSSIRQENSPPPTPPSPVSSETGVKLSKKREREASQEPVTTTKVAVDTDTSTRDSREIRTPAKKNRVALSSTAEEDDGIVGSRSNSPSPTFGSPPQEMKIKVRQISQGVEDLSWRKRPNFGNGPNEGQDSAVEMPVDSDKSDKLEETSIPNGSADPKMEPEENNGPKVDEASTVLPPTPPPTVDEVLPKSLRRDSDSDSGEKDKGLKRKFLDRGTSQGPQETGGSDKTASEPVKRPRDDAGEDGNPRETKRPSPPPEQSATSPPSAPAPKFGGFGAYAATKSPFASVKGPNVFGSKKSSSLSTPSVTPSVSSSSLGTPVLGESSIASTSAATPAKRSGFEAFSSPASPFASIAQNKSSVLGGGTSKLGRSKSPTRRANSTNASAFSAYSGASQGFALPAFKRARAGSPAIANMEKKSNVSVLNGSDSCTEEDSSDGKSASFGEKLRAGKDQSGEEHETPKIALTEQEVMTGEEEEETIHQVRGKLFALSDGTAWKERGTGVLKLNVRASDGGGARLLMRKEAVYTVLLNVTLFHGMRCVLAQDPRYVRFSVIQDGVTTHYNLRLANPKIAEELMEEIHANLPSA